MKTRELDVDPTDFDPFKDMPSAKPLRIEDVNSILNSANNAPVATTNAVEIVSSEKNAVDLNVNTSRPDDLSDDWIRQELPSLCIPYSFREVWLRPLTIRALSKLHSARVNQSFPILVDALNNCINVDIRELTPEDFVFVMHWVRDNSYPTIPLRINHKTKYGNTIEVNIRRANLKITEFNMTREEYAEWYKQGFAVPTVRDAELINRNEEFMDSEQEWMLETAQFIRAFDDDEEIDYTKYVDNKFARLEKIGPTVIIKIDEFKQLIRHGIQQTIEVVDTKFEPTAACAYLENEIAKIRAEIKNIPEDTVEDAAITIMLSVQEAKELETLRDEILQTVQAGGTYVPKKEVVAVTLTATEFFPRV